MGSVTAAGGSLNAPGLGFVYLTTMPLRPCPWITCVLLSVAVGVPLPASVESSPSLTPLLLAPMGDGITELPPFIVQEHGQLYLQLSFRSHLFFRGLKSLHIRSLPTPWQRAGILLGDEVVAINGTRLQGLGLLKFVRLGKEWLAPLSESPPRPTSLVFTIRSHVDGAVRDYTFIQSPQSRMVIGTPHTPPAL